MSIRTVKYNLGVKSRTLRTALVSGAVVTIAAFGVFKTALKLVKVLAQESVNTAWVAREFVRDNSDQKDGQK